MHFFCAHILQSEAGGECFYTGVMEALWARLAKHNAGEVPYTAKHRQWRIKTAIVGTDQARVIAFELYRKSTSGQASAKNRL
jgi:putative endonuclease